MRSSSQTCTDHGTAILGFIKKPGFYYYCLEKNISTVLTGMNISPTYSLRISSTNTEIVWFLPWGTGGSLTFILFVNCCLYLYTISEKYPHPEACLSQMFLEISVYLQKQYLWLRHGLVSRTVSREWSNNDGRLSSLMRWQTAILLFSFQSFHPLVCLLQHSN